MTVTKKILKKISLYVASYACVYTCITFSPVSVMADESHDLIGSPTVVYTVSENTLTGQLCSDFCIALENKKIQKKIDLTEQNISPALSIHNDFFVCIQPYDRWVKKSTSLYAKTENEKFAKEEQGFIRGDKVICLEEQGEYTKIAYGESYGFIKTKDLTSDSSSVKSYKMWVKNKTSVYKTQNIKNGNITTIKRGDTITCIENMGDYTLVQINGKYGYAKTSQLSSSKISPYRINLSNAELDMFYRCVMAEAGGESYRCQQMVAEVIINRVISGNWPNSVNGVITQPRQFSVYPNMMNRTPSESVKKAVQEALTSQTIPSNVLSFRSKYYHESLTPYTHVDNTYFSYN